MIVFRVCATKVVTKKLLAQKPCKSPFMNPVSIVAVFPISSKDPVIPTINGTSM